MEHLIQNQQLTIHTYIKLLYIYFKTYWRSYITDFHRRDAASFSSRYPWLVLCTLGKHPSTIRVSLQCQELHSSFTNSFTLFKSTLNWMKATRTAKSRTSLFVVVSNFRKLTVRILVFMVFTVLWAPSLPDSDITCQPNEQFVLLLVMIMANFATKH